MNGQGLAQAGAPVQSQGQMDSQGQERQMIDQVKQMLMQGVQPQELLQKGVPPEIIKQAIMELQQEMSNQQGQEPMQEQPVPVNPGLAAQGAM